MTRWAKCPALAKFSIKLQCLFREQISGSQVACTSASLAWGHHLQSRTCWHRSLSEQPVIPTHAPPHSFQGKRSAWREADRSIWVSVGTESSLLSIDTQIRSYKSNGVKGWSPLETPSLPEWKLRINCFWHVTYNFANPNNHELAHLLLHSTPSRPISSFL